MKRRMIFKKLVNGYKTRLKWELDNKPSLRAISNFPEGPMEIKGEVSIRDPVKEQKMRERLKIEGIEIPGFDTKRVSKIGIHERDEEEYFSMVYPLIPETPEKNQPIMAYAKIRWDPDKSRHEYIVVQPKASMKLKRLITRIKEILEEKLDVDFSKFKKQEAKDHLKKQALKYLEYFKVKLSETERQILIYYIERDFLGLGPLEPLMHDPNIEDISCDGVNIPVYVFHRDPSLGSIPTNVIFKDKEKLDTYLIRMAQLCEQSVSVIDPLLQGTLPDGSRVQGTLATDIARRGSNFTIRKFTKIPLTVTHLLDYETTDVKTLAFLWLTVDYGSSILVSGGTAAGKTVFLNVLSSFIKSEMKVVSIEDTAELKLLHPHWIPHVSRIPITTEKGRERGQVDLFDLLKESMRQRPDYIILGEVRGKEAYVLFQQMATGHPSLATIHADTMEKLIDRLTTPPIDLSPSLIESLDLIIFLGKMKYKGRFTRRLESIYEVIGFDREDNIPLTNLIFEWDSSRDKTKIKNESTILKKILKKTGMNEKELVEELKRRMIVLYWLQERGINDYHTISQVISLYYSYPERIMDVISGEI